MHTLILILSITVYLDGHIRPIPTTRLTIFVKEENKILAKTTTNSKGDFSLTFNSGSGKSSDFYYTGEGMDTLLLASIKQFENETPNITFSIPARRKKNAAGKVICPKCEKADHVKQLNTTRYYCEKDKVKF
ncbi:hypothetical protein GFS24_26260 [Chitinophaga sp. SYP-B3965]|uniref:hypothetical protein n=1 Tax=Chitinophaga sp. SYP-B3965 TaxID=2663120 RepID=UPI0012999384|nr:hypothetical protein [Chitinophaga sp. SYP-B3965]MRG48646.1 hypothetical protein [Chitinophaga sp. SYP-B3965]